MKKGLGHECSDHPPSWDRVLTILSRLAVWGIFFGIFYLLKSFFLLIFLTFVFAYIQSTSVNRLEKRIKNRTLRVYLVAGVFLGILVALILYVVPKVINEAENFFKHFDSYIASVDQQVLDLSEKYPIVREAFPTLKKSANAENEKEKLSPVTSIAQDLYGTSGEEESSKHLGQIIETIKNISASVMAIVSAFLLSLLFSFLIVLDLPRLGASVKELENTKLRFIYREVAGNIHELSNVLGKALEAQFFIALVNSFLTSIGLMALGLGKNVAFLAVIVFLCSFIPVAGVFISSVPICLIALQTCGLNTMLLSIVMVIIIHLIEGYILNPKIYGSHMRINAVIVLIILTISGKLFHFWGLILGVPICSYFFGHAIRIKKKGEATGGK